MVATCGAYQTGIARGEMCLFVSNDTMRTWAAEPNTTANGYERPGLLHP